MTWTRIGTYLHTYYTLTVTITVTNRPLEHLMPMLGMDQCMDGYQPRTHEKEPPTDGGMLGTCRIYTVGWTVVTVRVLIP